MKAFYKRVTDGAPKGLPFIKPDTSPACQRMQSDFSFSFFFFQAGFAIFGVECFKVSGTGHQVSHTRKARNCSNCTSVSCSGCSEGVGLCSEKPLGRQKEELRCAGKGRAGRAQAAAVGEQPSAPCRQVGQRTGRCVLEGCVAGPGSTSTLGECHCALQGAPPHILVFNHVGGPSLSGVMLTFHNSE